MEDHQFYLPAVALYQVQRQSQWLTYILNIWCAKQIAKFSVLFDGDLIFSDPSEVWYGGRAGAGVQLVIFNLILSIFCHNVPDINSSRARDGPHLPSQSCKLSWCHGSPVISQQLLLHVWKIGFEVWTAAVCSSKKLHLECVTLRLSYNWCYNVTLHWTHIY